MNRGKPHFGKRPHSQFDNRKNNGKSKRHNSTRDHSTALPKSIDTIYRILCPGKKIGGVIGKGGSIINTLRDETGAKIRVAETIPGVDERVIIIFSSPTRKFGVGKDSENGELTEKEHELMEPHCAAQDALLRVHDRIVVEEDQYGGLTHETDEHDDLFMARLLVPNNQVGCLLGKGGGIIQKLRSETGATIRILPMEHLPSGAMITDELVQISGTLNVVKKALYEVSTLLHQNPRKENPPPLPTGPHGLYPSGAPMPPMPPQGNPMWSNQNSGAHGAPPMPWFGGYRNEAPPFPTGGFNGIPARNDGEAAQFSMKILCPVEKTGGVIGKGGSNVKQLEKETGANIQVENAVPNAEERVIIVSATEAPWDPRSPTIQAILQLQSRTSEITEKGIVSTRLLVPSSKVGCLLGQGGHVITEMRRRTQADIRVYSKNDKPNCASADEELVQISGNMGVAKDALSEIASRLRERTLRGANAAVNPVPAGPIRGAAPPGNFSGRELPPPGMIGPGGSGSFDHLKLLLLEGWSTRI
ncbi:KH domain-containing protein HEN4-like isoform X2 [Magnolia sinica]|uniref:KH domain-containing protein HEN4-like isoform X2 n=1 Tax=Magnolia sinica TaxID=86752 RepID=UPI002657E933|nr:KH domain-containing protein HEN4-like isoform X2 [Magnolia sinica]